jgi:hypothetical protein
MSYEVYASSTDSTVPVTAANLVGQTPVGTYDLSAVMTKARDYGTVSLAVDGSQLGQPFDGYNFPNVTVATVDYGSVALSAGAHKLTFTLVGKNPSSINYLVGIDYLLLTKTN